MSALSQLGRRLAGSGDGASSRLCTKRPYQPPGRGAASAHNGHGTRRQGAKAFVRMPPIAAGPTCKLPIGGQTGHRTHGAPRWRTMGLRQAQISLNTFARLSP